MPLTVSEETILCRDCSESFVFTVAEQRFYAERALKRPVCCPACRAARRAARNAGAIRAADGGSTTPASEKFGNFAGITNGGGSPKRTSRSAAIVMHTAICGSCGC